MSTSVYTWVPNKIREVPPQYKVLISRAEAQNEQRRMLAHRGVMSWEFAYDDAIMTSSNRNSIYDFWVSRKGMYDTFYLPSFKWDGKLSTAYTTGTTLNLSDTSRFSAVSTDRNSSIVIIHPTSGLTDVRTISSLSSTTLVVNSELSRSYPIGTEVDICYVARFADGFQFGLENYFLTTASIKFTEVLP